jgi:hypothetical protein
MPEKLIKKEGGGTRKYEGTAVLVTTLRNKTTGRYAGKLKTTYGSGHNESMDDILPINPSTGKPVEALQQPLPEPEKKK